MIIRFRQCIRRRHAATGLMMALMCFGAIVMATADPTGRKPPPPPPPRTTNPDFSNNQGKNSSMSLPESTVGDQRSPLPKPPPRPLPPSPSSDKSTISSFSKTARIPPPPPPRRATATAVQDQSTDAPRKDRHASIRDSLQSKKDTELPVTMEKKITPPIIPQKDHPGNQEASTQNYSSWREVRLLEDREHSHGTGQYSSAAEKGNEKEENERASDRIELPTSLGIKNDSPAIRRPLATSRTTFEDREIVANSLRQNQQHQQTLQGTFSMPLSYRQTSQGIPVQYAGQNRYYQDQQLAAEQQTQPAQYSSPPPRLSQQRQQHQKIPSRGSSTTKKFFKSVLGSVEKGLDELVNIEGNISKGAQRLVSTATSYSSVSNAVSSASKLLSSKQINSSQSRMQRSTRAKKAEAKKAEASAKKAPFAHLGQKYKDVHTQKQSKPDVTSKLIRANGGASAPYGQTPSNPGSQMVVDPIGQDTTPPKPSEEQSMLPADRPFPIEGGKSAPESSSGKLGNSDTYVGSPYAQGNLQRQVPQKKLDPHSRQSRIPWESSPSNTQRPSQNQPRPTFDEEKTSWKEKISRLIPRFRLPNPAKLFRFKRNNSFHYASMDAWNNDDDDSRRGLFGIFKKKRKPSSGTARLPASSSQGNAAEEAMAPPLASLMVRSDNAKSMSLLSECDEKKSRSIGRAHASFDFVLVMLLVLGMQQLPGLDSLEFASSLAAFTSETLPNIVSIMRRSFDTWAPFWFAYAYLTKVTRSILLEPKVTELLSSVAATVEDDSVYAQLYLRLVAALPMDAKLPGRMSEAAASQIKSLVSRARLNAFVTMILSVLVVMTVSVLRPALVAIGTSLVQIVTLDEWTSWPIDWRSLVDHYRVVFRSLFLSLETVFANGLSKLLENPLQIAFKASIFGSLLLATMIPGIEGERKVSIEEDDDDEAEVSTESAEQLSKLGASSANRLTLLSENGSVENALERWRMGRVSSLETTSTVPSSPLIRMVCYFVLAGIVTLAPLLVSFFVNGARNGPLSHTGLQWDSGLDVSVILLYAFFLLNDALKESVLSRTALPYVKSFLSDVAKTLEEMRHSDRQADLRFMASVSASAGLKVTDLWAAHTSKRAWAVRGASLECPNGEIIAVLGDDGSGKTRLLTTIAETLVVPPKRSLTSNKVRGLVAVGGLDATKWDSMLLKRRLGILLSDVRSVGDTATLFSGWTMEEILEPVDGIRASSHMLSASEKSSIILGLKITGLYSTLIPRLQSKLSTVITANEEDLHPSPLRPRSTVLSPAEWSKLILTKVLVQTIADNDNAAASTDKIESSLTGSILLLDDATVLLSEVEEAKILRALRQTGAATVLTSNKWATGRFADRIAVMKDGAIVESGTHNELIARGPQQSLYAAKWHAMTMS